MKIMETIAGQRFALIISYQLLISLRVPYIAIRNVHKINLDFRYEF